MECRPFLKAVPGATNKSIMRIRKFLTIFLCLFSLHSYANDDFTKDFEQHSCAYGSHKELYRHFTKNNFIVFAQGKRIQPNGTIKDFADVLFLVSPDMQFFHAATLNGIKYNHFKACIFTSAQEVDYQFAAPIPDILQRKNREHLVFLNEDMPAESKCPANTSACTPWSQWSHGLNDVFLLSAYSFSSTQSPDPYSEKVDLTLDGKTIQPTRGKLSRHARQKYALRMRNALNESKKEIESAKTVYRNIYDEIDHQLPLMKLKLTDKREWIISEIDRESGLVWNLLEGIDLELYPMRNDEYKVFLKEDPH